MDEFEEGKEQDVIDILYDYDEDSGNIISKETREKLKNITKRKKNVVKRFVK